MCPQEELGGKVVFLNEPNKNGGNFKYSHWYENYSQVKLWTRHTMVS